MKIKIEDKEIDYTLLIGAISWFITNEELTYEGIKNKIKSLEKLLMFSDKELDASYTFDSSKGMTPQLARQEISLSILLLNDLLKYYKTYFNNSNN